MNVHWNKGVEETKARHPRRPKKKTQSFDLRMQDLPALLLQDPDLAETIIHTLCLLQSKNDFPSIGPESLPESTSLKPPYSRPLWYHTPILHRPIIHVHTRSTPS